MLMSGSEVKKVTFENWKNPMFALNGKTNFQEQMPLLNSSSKSKL